ncbi:MAG TPA: hypothetical protein VIQ31_08750 [Phormidium sp.]
MSKASEINWLTERFLKDFCKPSVVQIGGILYYTSCQPTVDEDLYLFLNSKGESLCEQIHENIFFRIGITPYTLILQAWHKGEKMEEEKKIPLDSTLKHLVDELTMLLIKASKPYFDLDK